MDYVAGVDIGGTFTDCIVLDSNGDVTMSKADSTPPDFETGFLDSMAAVAAKLGISLGQLCASARGIYHGCTVGTNALVERRAAPVALLVTAGHPDTLEFMRAGRRLLHSTPEEIAHLAAQHKPAALVPRA